MSTDVDRLVWDALRLHLPVRQDAPRQYGRQVLDVRDVIELVYLFRHTASDHGKGRVRRRLHYRIIGVLPATSPCHLRPPAPYHKRGALTPGGSPAIRLSVPPSVDQPAILPPCECATCTPGASRPARRRPSRPA